MKEEALPVIDSARIMEEIRSRVAERKAAGGYSKEDIRKITAMELKLREREGCGEETDRHISWLHAHWEATGPVDVEDQAPSSPLKSLLKKVSRSLLAPLTRFMLGKQNQINARVVQILSGNIPPLRDGLEDAENRGDQRFAALEKEVQRLAEEVVKLEGRLARLDPSAGDADGKREGP